jgi:hypothetical protein
MIDAGFGHHLAEQFMPARVFGFGKARILLRNYRLKPGLEAKG